MVTAFLFYACIFLIILFLARRGENTSNEKKIRLAYVFLFLLFALRFDIGNDYAGYWTDTELLIDVYNSTHSIWRVYDYRDGRYEIGYVILCCLFSWSKIPFFWCNAVYSMIVVISFYFVFKKHSCHFWGLFSIIVLGFIFLSFDWIRQSAAFAFILLAMHYAKTKQMWTYIGLVLLASIFHKSAIYMLTAYPLAYFNMTNKLILSVILGGLALYWSGLLQPLVDNITIYFSYIDGYNKYGFDSEALGMRSSIYSQIRITVFVLVGSLVILKTANDYSFYRNVITVGLFVFMIGGNSLLFNRIAWYFMIAVFPMFGICMNDCTYKPRIRKLLLSFILLQSFVFSYDIITNTNARGCVPYESVFSKEFQNQQFRIRSYK